MTSSRTNCSFIDRIEKALQKEDLESTLPELALRLIEFETANAEPENALCQRGISNANNAAVRIAKALGEKSAFLDMADARIKDFEGRREELNHRQRRQSLEDIIRILQPEEEKSEDSRLPALLARAYLYRGLLYRPKGRITPARKTEAIRKAVRLSEKAIQNLSDKSGKAVFVWRTWAEAALELERAEDYSAPLETLKAAALQINADGITSLTDILILLRYAERSKKNAFKGKLTDLLDKKEHWWGHTSDIYLLKARIAFLFGHSDKEVWKYLKNALDHVPDAFSNPFWDDLVDFVKKLRDEESDLWKKTAIRAHGECRKKEAEIASGVVLRWYWSRQKDLYDLAFLAADHAEKKAEIADSLKSRPVLRYQTLRELKDIGTIGEILDREDEARDGRYLKTKPEPKEKEIVKEIKKKQAVPFRDMPEPWVAIHFYLNDFEKKGYALIFDAASRDDGWKECIFDYRELHRKFLAWQELYFSGSEDSAADSLVLLCREIGRTMPFLFDGTLPENSRVLWIPHGFLHRLPLHAAIRADDKVFLEKHISRYLPAWNMLTSDSVKDNEASEDKGGFHMIKRLRPEDSDNYFQLNEREWKNKEDEGIYRAKEEDLKASMEKNPQALTLICHGHGDILNPLKSWLELEDSGMTVLDILKSEAKLSGTRVLLGACESDMAPPTEHTIDEHLSLCTVFLSHNAREIVAGLWEIQTNMVDGCYHQILDSNDISEALKQWQEDQMKKRKWKERQDHSIFYLLAPFRVMGFPEISETKAGE